MTPAASSSRRVRVTGPSMHHPNMHLEITCKTQTLSTSTYQPFCSVENKEAQQTSLTSLILRPNLIRWGPSFPKKHDPTPPRRSTLNPRRRETRRQCGDPDSCDFACDSRQEPTRRPHTIEIRSRSGAPGTRVPSGRQIGRAHV